MALEAFKEAAEHILMALALQNEPTATAAGGVPSVRSRGLLIALHETAANTVRRTRAASAVTAVPLAHVGYAAHGVFDDGQRSPRRKV